MKIIQMLILNMTVITKNIQIKSKSENDIIDITNQVSKIVKERNIENGTLRSTGIKFTQ